MLNVVFFKTDDADLARKLIRHLDATSLNPISYDADGAVTVLKCEPAHLYRLKAFAEGFEACFQQDKPPELQSALPKGFVDQDWDGLG